MNAPLACSMVCRVLTCEMPGVGRTNVGPCGLHAKAAGRGGDETCRPMSSLSLLLLKLSGIICMSSDESSDNTLLLEATLMASHVALLLQSALMAVIMFSGLLRCSLGTRGNDASGMMRGCSCRCVFAVCCGCVGLRGTVRLAENTNQAS